MSGRCGVGWMIVLGLWAGHGSRETFAQPPAKSVTPVGSWEMQATDQSRNKWTGKLVLTTDENGDISGHIDWTGAGASGREIVSVEFDSDTRAVSITGEELEDAKNISLATYSAKLSKDGALLENGKWMSEGVGGEWTAKRAAAAARPAEQPVPKKTGFVRRRFRASDGTVSRYVIFVPHQYNGKKEFPVILFLHGSGETKGAGAQPVDVGLGPYIRNHEKAFPFIALFPQAEEEGWRPRKINGEIAFGILDRTLKNYQADARRVYLTGMSMGGSGTWNFAVAEPKRWAAIVPICGASNPDKAEKIKDIPCWAFHGSDDQIIPVSESRQMVRALKQAGGNPHYTEFPGVRHACWDQAYNTPALWIWLAKQKRDE